MDSNTQLNNDRLVVHDYPLVLWLVGLIALGFAAMSYYQKPSAFIGPAIGIAGFLLIFLLSSVLTVTGDRATSLLTLKYSGLLRRKIRKIPISDITSIELERSTSTSYRNRSSSYRIVVITRGNQSIPFHSYYTGGAGAMQSKVNRLREFLGLGGRDLSTSGILHQGMQMAQEQFQQQQESLTGSQAEEHITDGVHWKVQTVTMGAAAVTRWFSPDFQCVSGFVFLAQKVAGQKTMAGGLMGGLGKFIFQQTMGLYGFGSDDIPGLSSADVINSPDPGLDPHFSAFTSDAAAARQILNPWAITPLADWGTRYPLKQVQKAGLFGQLVVLFSPRGVYVSSLGTMIPEALDELTNLGVALIKAQGSTPGRIV